MPLDGAARPAHSCCVTAHALLSDPFDEGVVVGDCAHGGVRDTRSWSQQEHRGRGDWNRRHPPFVVEGDCLLVLVDAPVFQIDEAERVAKARQSVQVVHGPSPGQREQPEPVGLAGPDAESHRLLESRRIKDSKATIELHRQM